MHCWNSICVCRPLAPGVAFPEHKCGHAPISALSGSGHVFICGSDHLPPPSCCHIPPSAALINPWRAVRRGKSLSLPLTPARRHQRPSLCPHTHRSQAHAGLRSRLLLGVRREQGDKGGAGENSAEGFTAGSLRLVLSEQSLIGPSALSGTLLPGLNNECAGLPLALRALIISQGPVFSHVHGIRG